MSKLPQFCHRQLMIRHDLWAAPMQAQTYRLGLLGNVVSVLISVTTDMSPTGDLLVT